MQLLPQGPHLFLHLPPQHEPVQAIVLICRRRHRLEGGGCVISGEGSRSQEARHPLSSHRRRHLFAGSFVLDHPIISGRGSDRQKARHKRLLHIREAKAVRNARDSLTHLHRKGHIPVPATQLLAPEDGIPHPLRPARVREQILAIEATRPLGDAGVQSLEMIGAADDQDAVVAREAVDFVQEIGAHGVGDDGVEVLEDEEAGALLAGFCEDGGEGVFGPPGGGEGADVEGWDGVVGQVGEGVHHCFYGNGFAVACFFGGGCLSVV